MPKLLVGLDLEEGHAGPVRWGRKLAEWTGFEVHLVHVVEKVPAEAGVQILRSRHPEVLERLLAEAKEEVFARVRAWGEEGAEEIPVTVRIGRPARELTALARADRDDPVLVLGPGHKRWMNALLGTTTDRVLRISTVPVLVARGAAVDRPRRVLAALDLSEGSDAVLRQARTWSEALGAELTVFHVPQPRWSNAFLEGRKEHVLDEMFEGEEGMRRRAGAELEELVASVTGGGSRPSMELGEPGADPAGEIAARVEGSDVGLLVMGTHGIGGVDRFILGSVADSLTQRAPVPVLVVPLR